MRKFWGWVMAANVLGIGFFEVMHMLHGNDTALVAYNAAMFVCFFVFACFMYFQR